MTPDQPCSDLRVLPPQIAHLPLAHRHSTRGDTVRLTSQDGSYHLQRARGITEGLEPFPCRRAGRPRMSSSMGMSLWRQVVYAPPEILPKHRDKLSRLDTRRHFVRSGVKVDCPPRDINIRIEKPHLAPTRQPLSSSRNKDTHRQLFLARHFVRQTKLAHSERLRMFEHFRREDLIHVAGERTLTGRSAQAQRGDQGSTYSSSSAPRNSTAYLSSLHVSINLAASSVVPPGGTVGSSSRATAERTLRVPRVALHVGGGQYNGSQVVNDGSYPSEVSARLNTRIRNSGAAIVRATTSHALSITQDRKECRPVM